MAVLPNLIYRFNEILIKITANYFVDMEKLIRKCIWKGKTQNSKHSGTEEVGGGKEKREGQ